MIIMLVEATNTDALVTKVKEQNYRSAEDIRQKSNDNILAFFLHRLILLQCDKS